MITTLQSIIVNEPGAFSDAAPGTVFVDTVVLSIGGQELRCAVTTTIRPIAHVPADISRGDAQLEELLRFEPASLSAVYRAVGATRRGEQVQLPIVLLEEPAERLAM